MTLMSTGALPAAEVGKISNTPSLPWMSSSRRSNLDPTPSSESETSMSRSGRGVPLAAGGHQGLPTHHNMTNRGAREVFLVAGPFAYTSYSYTSMEGDLDKLFQHSTYFDFI